jgi:signal transduction histidine kinase
VTVSQRLYLAVVPAILGVFVVAGLAYWGPFGSSAPHVIILVVVVASVASLVVAWRNTRYVATRVSRLAAPVQATRIDELDTIEDEVARLRGAVADASAAQSRAQAAADQRVREYAELMGDAATMVARQLDEVRIPLHILLESRFGDLNENQEEMLAAARTAADDVHTHLDRLRAIADVDRGALGLRPERVKLGEVVAMLLPGLAAAARQAGVTVESNISPLVPAAIADRAWLSEALSLLATDALRRTPSGGRVALTSLEAAALPHQGDVDRRGGGGDPTIPLESPALSRGDRAQVQLAISHGVLPGRPIDVAFADRLISVQGGSVQHSEYRMVITLPPDHAGQSTLGTTATRATPSDGSVASAPRPG